MVDPAPVTFSTMMGWPSDIRMPSLKTRPSVSVGPPAGNGTIIVMGCVGYSCARAPIPQAKLAHPSAAATATARDIVFMGSLLVFCGDDDTRADNAKVRSAVVLPKCPATFCSPLRAKSRVAQGGPSAPERRGGG